MREFKENLWGSTPLTQQNRCIWLSGKSWDSARFKWPCGQVQYKVDHSNAAVIGWHIGHCWYNFWDSMVVLNDGSTDSCKMMNS